MKYIVLAKFHRDFVEANGNTITAGARAAGEGESERGAGEKNRGAFSPAAPMRAHCGRRKREKKNY